MNGIDGDRDATTAHGEIHELIDPEVTALQEGYVRKVIDTVNDLDNVLYEIGNESHAESVLWQYHMIDFIKTYQGQKSKQHPGWHDRDLAGVAGMRISTAATRIGSHLMARSTIHLPRTGRSDPFGYRSPLRLLW